MWQNDKMLSLISNRYSFTGGADAVQKKVYINFALDNGEVITNENLFTDEDKVLAIADKYFRIAHDTAQVESLDGKSFDFEDGKFQGFEVTLAEALSKDIFGGKAGKVECVPVKASERLKALEENKVDMVLATFTITNERKQLVDFTTPYFSVNIGVLTRVEG